MGIGWVVRTEDRWEEEVEGKKKDARKIGKDKRKGWKDKQQ